MARKKQSSMEKSVEFISYFHWMIGVGVAIVSYFFLHWLAIQEISTVGGMDSLVDITQKSMIRTIAMFGQYLVPIVCLAGAFMSFYNRKRRAGIYEDTKSSKAPDPLNNITWHEFELLVGEYFKRQGYKVQETAGGADGGVDLVLEDSGVQSLVQCKQWKAQKVGVKVIRELAGVIASNGAGGGYVVTSGQFTHDAKAFAQKNNIQLINGRKLQRIIADTPPPETKNKQEVAPVCPRCGSAMVKRVAKRGRNIGEQFWGCSRYPKCRATV